jgi:hypothetical protein
VKVSLEQHDKNKPKNRYVNERIGGTLQRLSSCPICGGNLTFLRCPPTTLKSLPVPYITREKDMTLLENLRINCSIRVAK